MDVMRARVALRERSLTEVCDLAVRFCAAHALDYAKLTALVVAPSFAVSWLVAAMWGWPVGWGVAAVLASFAEAPFLLLVSKLLFDDDVSLSIVLRDFARLIPRVAAVRFAQVLALLFGVALGGVGWMFTAPLSLFLLEIAVLERVWIRAGWPRSRRLATANFPVALGTLCIVAAVGLGAVALSDWAGRELLEGLEIRSPQSMWTAGGSWLAMAGGWIAVPVVATLRFFAYIDCRTRGEGWDIQTRFAALAAQAQTLAEGGTSG